MNKFTQHSNGYFCSLSCSPSRLLLFLLFYFAYRIFFPTLALLFIISFHHCESSIMPAHGKILICEQSIRSNTMIFIYQLTSRYSNKNTHELLLICVLPFPLFFFCIQYRKQWRLEDADLQNWFEFSSVFIFFLLLLLWPLNYIDYIVFSTLRAPNHHWASLSEPSYYLSGKTNRPHSERHDC